MKFKRRTSMERGSLTTIDIAPLVDIIFLLLIFFMLTSSFVFQPGIKVNLPKAITSEVLGQESIIITVTGENLIYYNGKLATMKQLEENLKIHSNRPLLIKADRKAALGRVVEVWDICRTLGIGQVNIATNQATQ